MKTATTALLWLLVMLSSGALQAQAPTLQWRQRIGVRRTSDGALAMLHSRHNRLVVAGTAYGPSGSPSAGLWILSNQGDSLRSMVYLQTAARYRSSLANAIAETPDGDFLLLGTYGENNNGQIITNHFLLRTDSLGNQRWVQHYHTGFEAVVDANACVALPDGGALLVMTRNDPAGVNIPIRIPTVMRVDAQGQVLWDRRYGPTYSELYNIVPLPDGSYALAGIYGYFLTNPSRLRGKPWLVRLTLDGDTISTKTFHIPQTTGFAYALRPLPDGRLLLVGSLFNPDQPNVPTQGLLLQLDAQDREAWHQLLVSPRQLSTDNCELYQVWPLPTPGQFVVAGSRAYPNSSTAGYGYLAQYTAAPGGSGAVPTWELQYLKYENYPRPYAYVLRDDHTLTIADCGRPSISVQPDVYVTRFTGLPAVYEPDLCATPPQANAAFTQPAASPDSLNLLDLGTPGPQYAQLVHWRWTLGDGTEVTQTTPGWVRHRYATLPAPGTPVTLTVTNNLGCTASQTLYPWGRPTASQQARALAAAAQLFPTPAASGAPLTLALPGLRPQPPVPAEVLDALGRVVQRFAVAASADAQVLPLGALPAGVYALRLHPREGSFTKRLVIR